jgi:hypothetical protein
MISLLSRLGLHHARAEESVYVTVLLNNFAHVQFGTKSVIYYHQPTPQIYFNTSFVFLEENLLFNTSFAFLKENLLFNTTFVFFEENLLQRLLRLP